MDKMAIQELIEKYYLGETSLEEDDQLMELVLADSSEQYQSEKAQFRHFKELKVTASTQPFVADLNKKNQGFLFQKAFSNQLLRLAASLLLLAGGSYVIYSINDQAIEVSTDSATTKEILLQDGSVVSLHFDSKLTYPKNFDRDTREVTLEGEGFFNISKDAQRPFIVHTFQTTTKVVGTEFNLRGYANDHSIQLDVVSGMVLFGADSTVGVRAGNSIAYEKDTKILSKSIDNIPNTAAWFKKQLVFENVELRSVFNDLENYFHVKFEIVDQDLLRCHFSGKFVDPSLRDVLSVLKYSLKITYTNKKGIYYINGKGCAQN